MNNTTQSPVVTRRGLLGAGVGTLSGCVAAYPGEAPRAAAPATPLAGARASGAPGAPIPTATVHLHVNGRPTQLTLDTRTTLLDALREHLHLTGSKKGCDHGQCGACTVLVEGRRINACLTLAVMHEGEHVTTIEGLGSPSALHPLQAAFVAHDGYQCGYCTPGQICSAVGMLAEVEAGVPSHVSRDLAAQPLLSPAELRERMSGNLCRCGGYVNIAAAIAEVVGTEAANPQAVPEMVKPAAGAAA